MSQHDTELLIEELNGVHLARILNRAAKAFDASELSNEEIIVLYLLLDRMIKVLWASRRDVLLPFYHSLLTRLGIPEEYEDDNNGGTGGTQH